MKNDDPNHHLGKMKDVKWNKLSELDIIDVFEKSVLGSVSPRVTKELEKPNTGLGNLRTES